VTEVPNLFSALQSVHNNMSLTSCHSLSISFNFLYPLHSYLFQHNPRNIEIVFFRVVLPCIFGLNY